MKTKNLFLQRMSNDIIALLMMVAFLTFNGCQKDDNSMPANSSDNSGQTVQRDINQPLTFSYIKFDHIAAKSLQPDFSVTVYRSGLFLFEGRRNVARPGLVKEVLGKATLSRINDMTLMIDFYSLRSAEHTTPDMPMVATTFAPFSDMHAVTILDDNGNRPESLIQFRRGVEKMLNLDKLIYGDVNDDN